MRKTILKTLSWAAVSGVIIGTAAVVESGSWRTAFVTALVSVLLKTPFYSIHEAVWARATESTTPHIAEGTEAA